MQLIDTHSHIYLKEFDRDQPAMLERAVQSGLQRILMPAVDSETHDRLLQLAQAHPSLCIAMMGLHPCSVKEDVAKELDLVHGYLDKQPFIAVGEIGLDFYWDTTFKEQQYDAFRTQLEWSKELGIPVSIHSRNATDEAIAVVTTLQDGRLKGAFHCFSGNAEQAEKAVAAGFHLGIGGVLTFKNSGLDKAIEKIDPNWFVLETDAPYLAPVPFRGKRNEPSYTVMVVEKLAEIKGTTPDEMASLTTANAQKLFGL